MESPFQTRFPQHLIRQILNRNADVPAFALFLGSGASFSSGVTTANGLINQWRVDLHEAEKTPGDFSEWLQAQDWCDAEDEYAILFETMYDQPAQRRNFVEELLDETSPSWGYVYLSSLLQANVFNVVFTTNFDDLIQESCFLYTDGLRPIVASHDSTIASVRLTSARPKIIKLHGDFLYDNIKNTVRELETLETNSKEKIRQFAHEYGLVVVGYSGRDRSVIDTLEMLVRSGEFFPHGIYWCMMRGEIPSKRLARLLRYDQVFVVEIDGFDQVMADLHKSAALTLPRPLSKPFQVAHERADLFVKIDPVLRAHPVISEDSDCVMRELRNNPREIPDLSPPHLEAMSLEIIGDLEGALNLWDAAASENPTNQAIAYRRGLLLVLMNKLEELRNYIQQAPLRPANQVFFRLVLGDNSEVVDLATNLLKREPTDAITRINRAIAHKRMGNAEELEEDLTALEKMDSAGLVDPRYGVIGLRAGVAALRHDKGNMMEHLANALSHGLITPSETKTFPVFEDYQGDPVFQSLVATHEKSRRPPTNGSEPE